MLIRFIVENFSSFSTQAELSMIAGRQEIHPSHLIQSPENDFKMLRTGVVFGPNASGKSNLIKAMEFARILIVQGTAPMSRIPVRPFLLDPQKKSEPSVFQFSFCTNSGCYTYGFKVTAEKVAEEWLSAISGDKETMLFERTAGAEGDAQIKFSKKYTTSLEDKNFLGLIARGTRPNQLFLTESVQRNVKFFASVWEWFSRRLTIIFPDTHAMGIEFAIKEKEKIAPIFMNLLRMFDTGIIDLDAHELPLENAYPNLPANVKNDFETMLTKEDQGVFITGPNNIRYAIKRNDKGDLVAVKLRARHPVRGSNRQVSFDFSEESEGTQRIVDLLPAITSLLYEDKVIIVDEIDRSLHPHITYALFDFYLNAGIKAKSQLVATTHAENLLTFKLLRKDEIWMIEKNTDGESHLYSMEEFKPRYDKDIMTGYMNGRFGAIPSINISKTPALKGF